MKEFFLLLSATIGVLLQHLFGGWDRMLEAMIVFMIIDIITGVVVAACKKSDKSKDGKLWSVAMRKGLVKKGLGLFFVIIAVELDALTGADYIRSATIFCILMQELLSITENAAVLGVPLPEVLRRTLTVLSDKVSDRATDKIANKVVGDDGKTEGGNDNDKKG